MSEFYEGSEDLVQSFTQETPEDLEGMLDGRKVGRELIEKCFYCGDTTQQITRDHVIPVSSKKGGRYYSTKDTVPCCKECNSTLGNKPFYTVESRALYLAERFAQKYKKALNTAKWDDEDIEELGKNLKSFVRSNEFLREFIALRISHCHEVAGSLYDPGEVSHLSGITTECKKSAYKILEEFLRHEGSITSFAEKIAERIDEDIKLVKALVKETVHYDVAVQLKYDYGYPLDASMQQLRMQEVKKQKEMRRRKMVEDEQGEI